MPLPEAGCGCDDRPVRRCSICTHPERAEVDARLAAGASKRSIAARFGTSASAVQRHRDHLGGQLSETEQARRELSAELVVEHLTQARLQLERAGRKARSPAELVAVASARVRAAEALARVMGPMLLQELLMAEATGETPMQRQDREVNERLLAILRERHPDPGQDDRAPEEDHVREGEHPAAALLRCLTRLRAAADFRYAVASSHPDPRKMRVAFLSRLKPSWTGELSPFPEKALCGYEPRPRHPARAST